MCIHHGIDVKIEEAKLQCCRAAAADGNLQKLCRNIRAIASAPLSVGLRCDNYNQLGSVSTSFIAAGDSRGRVPETTFLLKYFQHLNIFKSL